MVLEYTRVFPVVERGSTAFFIGPGASNLSVKENIMTFLSADRDGVADKKNAIM